MNFDVHFLLYIWTWIFESGESKTSTQDSIPQIELLCEYPHQRENHYLLLKSRKHFKVAHHSITTPASAFASIPSPSSTRTIVVRVTSTNDLFAATIVDILILSTMLWLRHGGHMLKWWTRVYVGGAEDEVDVTGLIVLRCVLHKSH